MRAMSFWAEYKSDTRDVVFYHCPIVILGPLARCISGVSEIPGLVGHSSEYSKDLVKSKLNLIDLCWWWVFLIISHAKKVPFGANFCTRAFSCEIQTETMSEYMYTRRFCFHSQY